MFIPDKLEYLKGIFPLSKGRNFQKYKPFPQEGKGFCIQWLYLGNEFVFLLVVFNDLNRFNFKDQSRKRRNRAL